MRFFKAKSSKDADVSGDNVADSRFLGGLSEVEKEAISIGSHSRTTSKNSMPSSEKERQLVNVPLGNMSAHEQLEKELSHDASLSPQPNRGSTISWDGIGRDVAEKDENQGGDDNQTDEGEEEYPNAWKLFLITIALCLCVFCVALVCNLRKLTFILSNMEPG